MKFLTILAFWVATFSSHTTEADQTPGSSSTTPLMNVTNSSHMATPTLFPSMTTVSAVNKSCHVVPSTCICDNASTVTVNMTSMPVVNMTMTSVSGTLSIPHLAPSSIVNGSSTVNVTAFCPCYEEYTICRTNITATPSLSSTSTTSTGPNNGNNNGNKNNGNNPNNRESSSVSATTSPTGTTTSPTGITTNPTGTTTNPTGITTNPTGITTNPTGTTTNPTGITTNPTGITTNPTSTTTSTTTSPTSTTTSPTSTTTNPTGITTSLTADPPVDGTPTTATSSSGVVNQQEISPTPTSTTVPTTSTFVCQITDCAGVLCGTAITNACSFCVGGTTGLNSTYGKDCNGICNGTARNDNCNTCTTPPENDQSGKDSPFADCNGTCFGDAEIDGCGQCAGGETGKAVNFSKDACDVCDGDNSTCLGCDGVANSGTENDACNVCGGDGTTCTTISSVSPSLLPTTSDTAREVTVVGAGLDGDSIKCVLDGTAFAGTKIDTQHCQCTIPNEGLSAGVKTFTIKVFKNGEDVSTPNLEMTLYDPAQIKVTGLSPAELLAGTATEITFTGSNFINSSDAVCIVDGVQIPAFYGGSDYKCMLPSYGNSKEISVGLSLNGIHQLASDVSLNLTVYAAAPVMTAAQFSDTGALINVEFDKNVDTSSLTTCAAIFQDVGHLGTNPECTWSDGRHLVVAPGSGATVRPLMDSLTLKASVVKCAAEQFSKFTSGGMNVQAPVNSLVPEAIITGPTQISSCGDLCLDSGTSIGSGGRPFKSINWVMAGANTVPAIIEHLDNEDGKSKVCINGSLMTSGTSYTYTLSVKNFLNKRSEDATITVTKATDPLPEVTVEGPLNGEVHVPDSFYITAFAQAASCSSDKALSYLWSVVCNNDDGSNSAKTKVEASAGYTTTSTKSRLKVDAGSLIVEKRYTFKVVVTAGGVSTNVETEVLVKSSALQTAIRGGDRTIGRDSGVTSMDSSTLDPDNALGSLSCSWSCKDLSNGQPCYSAVNKQSQIAMPDNCLIDLQSSEFKLGTYEITSFASKGTRLGTSTIMLTVIAGNPPVVSVNIADLTVGTNEKVNLAAKYTSTIQPTSVGWVSSDDSAYSFIDLTGTSTISSSSNTHNPNGDSYAVTVLKANVLIPGAIYKFIINVNDGSSIGTSNMMVKVRTGPTSGTLSTPSNLLNVLDSLTLTAQNWVTDGDAYPLKFQFGYADSTGVFNPWVTQSSCEYTIRVPPGHGPNNVLPLMLVVIDALGSKKVVDKNITVAPAILTEQEVQDIVNPVIQTAQDTGDYTQTVPLLSNVLAATADNQSAAINNLTVLTLIKAVKASLNEDTAQPLLQAYLAVEAATLNTHDQAILDSFKKIVDEAVKSDLDDEKTVVNVANWLGTVDVDNTKLENVEDVESIYQDLAYALGKNLDLGQQSAEVTTDDVIIRTKYSLLVEEIPTKADNGAASIDFGTELALKYGEWPCGAAGHCYGVLVQSVQFKKDFVTPVSSVKPPVLADKVVDIELRNPATGEILTVTGLSEPLKLKFNTGAPSSGKTFKGYFQNSVGVWSQTGLTTVIEGSFTTVSSTHLTTFGVAEEDITLTNSTNSTDSDVTTAAPVPDEVVHVSFVLSNTSWSDDYLNTSSSDYTSLSQTILTALTDVYTNDTALKDISIVGFEKEDDDVKALVKMTFDGSANGDPATTLKQSLADGNLGGLSVDKDSLTWVNAYEPAESAGDDDTALVIGVVFGIFSSLAAILLVAAWLKNRQSRCKVASSHNSINDEPQPETQEAETPA